MNGQVCALYDLNSISIPNEMMQVHVDMQEVERQVQFLGVYCAKLVDVSMVGQGDIVHCTADIGSYPDGRIILLFTGINLPGAEEAAKAAVGKKTGDLLAVNIHNQKTALTIRRIVHRVPAPVNDDLVSGLGIAGVTTVESYRAYILGKMLADQRMENRKKIIRYILDTMIARSTFDYDKKKMDATVDCDMEATLDEYAAEGLQVTPEEIRDNAVLQAKQVWLAKALCIKYGFSIDTDSVEKQVDQMTEMMRLVGEKVPDREKLLEEFREGEFMNGMFTIINRFVDEKTEGYNGSN